MANLRLPRITLGIVQLFVGLGAVPSGLIFIFNPGGTEGFVPISVLRGSPFDNFFIPGILLFAVNGLGSLLGAYWSLRSHRYGPAMAILLALFLLGWISAQMYWFEGISWLHILYLTLGLVELALGVWLWTQQRRHA